MDTKSQVLSGLSTLNLATTPSTVVAGVPSLTKTVDTYLQGNQRHKDLVVQAQLAAGLSILNGIITCQTTSQATEQVRLKTQEAIKTAQEKTKLQVSKDQRATILSRDFLQAFLATQDSEVRKELIRAHREQFSQPQS